MKVKPQMFVAVSTDPCVGCGLCCKKLIIEIDHVDVVREPRLLPVVMLLDGGGRIEYDEVWDKEYRLAPQAPGKRECPMLDGCGRCSIYATRPIDAEGNTLELCSVCKGEGSEECDCKGFLQLSRKKD